VQLAVVRSDAEQQHGGLLVATIRRDYLAFMARGGSDIEDIAALRGRTVGIVFAGPSNQAALRRVLAHYDIGEGASAIVTLAAEEAPAALRDERVSAVFAVGNPSNLPMSELVHRLSDATGGPVRFLPVQQAAAIARRSAAVEEAEILRGAFGGAPPRPPESVPTLGIAYRLVASRNVDDATIAALAQLVFALRPALSAELPAASLMEAPDTDRGAIVPVHPGAIQYVEGNIKSFFDRISDWFYLIVMLVGIAGSAIAGLASMAQGAGKSAGDGLPRLLDLMRAARGAPDRAALDQVETDVDLLFADTLKQIAARDLDAAQIAAYSLAFDQVRRAVADRRLALPTPRRPRLAAAE
jgi:hypothetical protein